MLPLAVPVPNVHGAVVPLLKSAVPDFERSDEYLLIAKHEDLPGVVLAAFAGFLIRMSADASALGTVKVGIGAINAIYETDDAQVREAIRDEFIERFDGEPAAVRAVQPFLIHALAAEFATILG